MTFPPVPVYPNAIDSDYTLFLVYNTSEAMLAADNSPWAQEISIVPVEADKPEIWPDNGFANIEGELFYYDSVEKNEHGKVIKFKHCARQLGGEKTKFNKKCTWVRGFVIAEHHNQIVQSIIQTQDFIGINEDPRVKTLDWRIRNLQDVPIIFDDFACPDINFTFDIVENDPVLGVLAEYTIEITPPGSINSFRLDFGDGEFTTTDLSGEHRYALNARIDPVIKVGNEKCLSIQTPIERDNPAEPPTEIVEVFDIPIPEIADFPDFTFVPFDVPPPDINLPPLVVPCISIEGQVGPIPSVIIVEPPIVMFSTITIVGTTIPSVISFTDPDLPNPISLIGPSPSLPSSIPITGPSPSLPPIITITGPSPPLPTSISITHNLPTSISLTPTVPATIVIDPPIPPTIIIIPPPSSIAFELDMAEIPRLEVDWGTPPEMEVALTLARPVKTAEFLAADPEMGNEFGQEFADLFDASHSVKVEYEPVGIPSEIRVIFPEDTPSVKLDADELFAKKIKVDASEVKFPSSIRIYGPDSPIPNSIRLDGSSLPDEIDLVYQGGPIKVDASTLPSSIKVDVVGEIPKQILIEMPKPIPERIIVEHNMPDKIVLEGPESIPLVLPEGIGIPVIFPEKMPEVELVWRGNPIEVKITMDEIIDKTADGKNCVMIVPCQPKVS